MNKVEVPNTGNKAKISFASKYRWLILFLVTIVLLLIWYFLPEYMLRKIPDSAVSDIPNTAPAERGQYGDMYGVITSLFSGLTIIGLIFTIIQQQESLKKQAEELELTKQALINQQQELKDNRTEIIHNRDEIKLQHQTVKFQRFENTFFNMLEMQSSIVRDIDLIGQNETGGRDCFKIFYNNHFQNELMEKLRQMGHTYVNGIPFLVLSLNDVIKVYEVFFEKQQHNLGHYFRHLYHLILHIQEANLSEAEKKKYAKIVRAQLSTYEMLLLFYNGLSEYGENFRGLIEKFSLLKGISTENLINQADDKYDNDSYTHMAFSEMKCSNCNLYFAKNSLNRCTHCKVINLATN